MTVSAVTLPLSDPQIGPPKKKRVLLVDASSVKRDLRAEIMRKLGIEVDCAVDIAEARSWWRANLYNLVLINVENELGQRDQFCEDIRSATPPQHFAYLVGKPDYLADSPNPTEERSISEDGDEVVPEAIQRKLSADGGAAGLQRWGILEASRQISAVRSACDARTRAIRNRPAPPRDLEARQSKPVAETKTLDDYLREEMQ
jgi:CheY-like chemotaxis protein